MALTDKKITALYERLSRDDNLVGYWRDKTGRHTDCDMWAQPVFNGINDYFILKTDSVEQ